MMRTIYSNSKSNRSILLWLMCVCVTFLKYIIVPIKGKDFGLRIHSFLKMPYLYYKKKDLLHKQGSLFNNTLNKCHVEIADQTQKCLQVVEKEITHSNNTPKKVLKYIFSCSKVKMKYF